jgi:hypothetical protein
MIRNVDRKARNLLFLKKKKQKDFVRVGTEGKMGQDSGPSE